MRNLSSHTPSQPLWSMVSSPGILSPCRSLSWAWECISRASMRTLKVKCAHAKARGRWNCSPLAAQGVLLNSVANLYAAGESSILVWGGREVQKVTLQKWRPSIILSEVRDGLFLDRPPEWTQEASACSLPLPLPLSINQDQPKGPHPLLLCWG